MEMCKISEMWILDSLKKLCEYSLSTCINFDNVDSLLEFSKVTGCKILYMNCIRFVLTNFEEVSAQEDSYFVQELRSLQTILPFGEEDLEIEASDNSRTLVLFRKAVVDEYMFCDSLAKLTFPLEQKNTHSVGLLYKICEKGFEITDFHIRLPNLIDLKMFGSKKCQNIIGSNIVSYAALHSDIFFGISNNNKFCGMLKYSILYETWDVLPFMPGMIDARMSRSRMEYVTFFIKNTKEGPSLKVMNIQKNAYAFHEHLLMIRSFVDGVLIVEHEIPKVHIPNGSLFYTSCPNVTQVGDEIFFVFKYEILVLDAENLFHCITPRDPDIFKPSEEEHRFYCVPIEEFEELLVIVHVKSAHDQPSDMCYWFSDKAKYRLNVFKYHIRKGYSSIPQPIPMEYSHRALHTTYHEDTLYVFGWLENGDSFAQSFNVMLNCWKIEKKISMFCNDRDYCYTNPFVIEDY